MISGSRSKRAKIARHSPRPHGRVLCKLADSANFLPWHLVLSVPLAYYGNGGSSVSRPGGILYIVISPCKMFNCCWGCVGYKFSYSIFEKWRFYGNKRGQIVWKMKLGWYYSPVEITGTSRSPLPPLPCLSLPPNRTGFDSSYFIILFDYIYNFYWVWRCLYLWFSRQSFQEKVDASSLSSATEASRSIFHGSLKTGNSLLTIIIK